MIQKLWRYAPNAPAMTGAASLLAAIIAACSLVSPVIAADTCTPSAATLVSVQGDVEVRRSSSAEWHAARLNDALCAGDMLRVGERSRAGLLLSNETTLRLDQNTGLTLEAPDNERPSLLDVLTGVINVISRTPHPFRVKTPFVNANVEGTEFLVGVSGDTTRVAVFEGRVIADNDRGSVVVGAGEQAIAAKDSAPRKEVMVRPRDAVQWALYFPTVFDYGVAAAGVGAPEGSALSESIELYRKGKVADALARLQSAPEAQGDPRILIYRAGLLLLVGRLDQARPVLERALAIDAHNSDAYSLQAVIAVAQNDKAEALKLAAQAVEANPNSVAARLAISYAQQSQFKIEDARTSAQKAADLDPQNALAWARLAELHMSTGNLDRALDAARRAARLNPDLAKTQSVLGFANLARIDTRAARQAFQKAIELDQEDPLPRLGLGLATVRDGDLKEGREQIEIATSLDPDRSLIRSYLGKAYYEEKRDKLASRQFELAKQLDHKDPTSWSYDAILKQTHNRPVEAFQDLQTSIEKNDNRAVFRSQLLLDEDRATRSAGLARIYQELGFEELALIEGAKAVAASPDNYAGHLFLADAYSRLPNEETARESEQLQFLLRQPAIISPVSALSAQDTFRSGFPKAGILREIAPAQPTFNEFNPLFERNTLSVYVDALGAQKSTGGDQFIVSGIDDAVSFNLGQAHFETAGFGENENFSQDAYIGMVQGRIDPATSIQAEIRQTDTEQGNFVTPFDPSGFPVQLDSRARSARIGGNYACTPDSDVLVSAIYQARDLNILLPSFGDQRLLRRDRAFSAEAQWSYMLRPFSVLAGAGYVDGSQNLVGGVQNSILTENMYIYGRFDGGRSGLIIEGGLSGDFFHEIDLRRQQVNPKAGLIWNFSTHTTLRAAVVRALQRPFVARQSLEPTQVAGFAQFSDEGGEGTKSTGYGVGVDQQLLQNAHVGVDFRRRDLEVPVVTVSTGSSVDYRWRDRAVKAYMYWLVPSDRERALLPTWSMAITAQLQSEKRERPVDFTGDEGIRRLVTTLAPVGLTLFPIEYLSLKLVGTHARQTGQLQVGPGPFFGPVAVDQSFWITDFSVEYRLPGRRGILAIGGSNLFGHKVDGYQEIDSENPQFARGRLLFGRFILQL